jgi:apolipoprotein N-acyltransferase
MTVALPLPRRLAFAGAVLSGLLYWVSFPGMDQWYLAFVALAPLYVALWGQPPRRALYLGLACGLAMTLGGFYWLLTMLKVFSGFPTALCLVFVVILCAYQGGRLALTGWLFARAQARGWPPAAVFVAAFAVSELVFPLLFPWYFAASVYQATALTQIAELGGPILLGCVLALVNVAVAEPLVAILQRRALDRRVTVGAAAALAATLLFGAWRIAAVKSAMESAEPLHVGLVQGNMGLMQKRLDPNEGLRRHLRVTESLRAKGVELVVWSESSVMAPVLEPRFKDELRWKVSSRLGVPAIFGGVLYRHDPDRDRWFNSAFSSTTAGEIVSRYDKHFLLMFGEYLPFGDTFPILYKWSPHSGKFTQGTGTDPLVVRVGEKTHKVTTLICYEDILPGFTNRAVEDDTDLLVNMTNDAWFGDSSEPWEHLRLAQFRAIEHRRYLVRSTNSGVSAIVDPLGRALAASTVREVATENYGDAEAMDANIKWMRGRTVYELVGDAPWYLLTAGMAWMAYASRRRRPLAA